MVVRCCAVDNDWRSAVTVVTVVQWCGRQWRSVVCGGAVVRSTMAVGSYGGAVNNGGGAVDNGGRPLRWCGGAVDNGGRPLRWCGGAEVERRCGRLKKNKHGGKFAPTESGNGSYVDFYEKKSYGTIP